VREEQSKKSDIDILVDFAPGKENFDTFMMNVPKKGLF
jgi:predicted nucleotidyltransferase